MKKIKFLLLLLVPVWGCSKEEVRKDDSVSQDTLEVADYYPAEDEDAVMLEGSAAARFERVLREVEPENFLEDEVFGMPEERRRELKTFLDAVVQNSPKEAIEAIADWVNKTVVYGYESLDPYEIMVEGKATTCQGYANAMRMACTLYGYPVVGVYGRLYNEQGPGHAYVYAYVDGRWRVYDALHDVRCDAAEVALYERFLVPEISDVALFKDKGFVYDYERGLNVRAVKKAERVVTVPYAKEGLCVTGCAFKEMLPPEVRELYLGSGVNYFGDNAFGLKEYARSLEHVFIAEGNRTFEVWEGVVYERNFNQAIPYFIPAQLEVVRLKLMHTVGKGIIADHVHHENRIREIYFTGTRRIEDYAVENCPQLECIYVAGEAEIAAKAFPEGVPVVMKKQG